MRLRKHRSPLDEEIERVVNIMKDISPTHLRYGKAADNLVKLSKAREEDSKKDVDPNTVITATTSLIGILLILNFEKLESITSKAMNMVIKTRI